MNTNDIKAFDEAVARSFAPMAAKFDLPLRRLTDGIYEISSGGFVMRIRLEIGHGKSILATIAQASDSDSLDPSNEIGLGAIVSYNDGKMDVDKASSCDELLGQAKNVAQKSEVFLIPYLLGRKNDIAMVKAHIEALIVASGMRDKKWKFPKNVREEWL